MDRTSINEPFNESEAKLIRLFCSRAEGFLSLHESGDFRELDRQIMLKLVDDLEAVIRGKQTNTGGLSDA
jgi:hypothetical protein